jgi:Flp pilus assembly protein CpaB
MSFNNFKKYNTSAPPLSLYSIPNRAYKGGFAENAKQSQSVKFDYRYFISHTKHIAVAILLGTTIYLTITHVLPTNAPENPVFVASQDIHPGEVITPNNTKEVKVYKDVYPAKALMENDITSSKKAIISISKGEIITQNQTNSDLLQNLPEGKVIVSINLSSSVSANIYSPETKVDLISKIDDKTSYLAKSATVLPNTNPDSNYSDDNKYLILAVSANEAQNIAKAQSSGEIFPVIVR